MKGIIEGFYGTPWTWEERRLVGEALADAGMDTYVYAPKDDPLHRERWREPYPEQELAGFAALVEEGALRVGVGISPGLSIDPESAEDRSQLLGKVRQLIGTGVSLIGLLLDDLDPAPGLGARHGALTAWLHDALDPEVELFVVPLHYTGTEPAPYLDELVAEVPPQVPIGWTGRYVVNRTITAEDARARTAATGGRAPLLWDNTPVNDAIMAAHLFTGPLRGRDPGLPEHLSGYLANPMVQARAGLPALLSAAAWLRGEDPGVEWFRAAGPDLVLLEGCDGAVPSALADAALGGDEGALEELAGWMADAAACDVGGLGEPARQWAEQLVAEAKVCEVALAVLRGDLDEARRLAPLLLVMWPGVRRAEVEVLGGRGSLVPALGQDDHSRWVAAPGCHVPAGSVTDRLVSAAFARLS